ncbi:hypothetical protein AMAG_18779 [Allomyces macrogynus ATCC 38327]|uniref:Uncharacterized protein n=1 Tax=Allomyces macrogynus (strain ATCC 38327) TaxID=578462 RepID=A0A0L0SHA5_ALLM3|nr:hypothetical protein AMAG_18779 [Allomyces macrogynus ATCC 38327]|eukprot:KNE61832.1 hypothetical protein AMAG_18779 [Allomyces macrogynus ATCC 38327]
MSAWTSERAGRPWSRSRLASTTGSHTWTAYGCGPVGMVGARMAKRMASCDPAVVRYFNQRIPTPCQEATSVYVPRHHQLRHQQRRERVQEAPEVSATGHEQKPPPEQGPRSRLLVVACCARIQRRIRGHVAVGRERIHVQRVGPVRSRFCAVNSTRSRCG